MSEDTDCTKEDEEEQIKKIKFLGMRNDKFKKTWRKLLEEDPGLMRGLGQSKSSPRSTNRRQNGRKRSNWESTAKKWREEAEAKNKVNKPASEKNPYFEYFFLAAFSLVIIIIILLQYS